MVHCVLDFHYEIFHLEAFERIVFGLICALIRNSSYFFVLIAYFSLYLWCIFVLCMFSCD